MKCTVEIHFSNSSIELPRLDLDVALRIEKAFIKKKIRGFKKNDNYLVLVDFSKVLYIEITTESPTKEE